MWKRNVSGRSSSPGELHPEALTEPCLSLSAHTALAIQRERMLSPQRPSSSSCCQLTTRSWREWPVPFAPRALPRFVTTTRQSVPDLRIRTLALVVPPLVASPLTSDLRFPRSVQLPHGKLRPPLMPDAAPPVSRYRRSLSRSSYKPRFWTSSKVSFRHFNSGSLAVFFLPVT